MRQAKSQNKRKEKVTDAEVKERRVNKYTEESLRKKNKIMKDLIFKIMIQENVPEIKEDLIVHTERHTM